MGKVQEVIAATTGGEHVLVVKYANSRPQLGLVLKSIRLGSGLWSMFVVMRGTARPANVGETCKRTWHSALFSRALRLRSCRCSG